MNQKAMYKLSYGLFVITANRDGKDNGCITNTVVQVTSEPNRISVTLNKGNYTHDMIVDACVFTVSVISENAKFDLFKRFGFQSGRDVDKFADYALCKRADNGTMIVTEGTNAFLSGKVIQSIDLGTHTMFVADVTDMEVLSDVPSATYVYYQENIKPKPQAVGKTEDGQTIWRCRICGYEYVGEELPEDFICPVCKHPASDFEKIAPAVETEAEKKIDQAK
jgi:flavin reductase (DIM6/NTAB) family NADH-FMN oxidoreductase RutF/rubredoxin